MAEHRAPQDAEVRRLEAAAEWLLRLEQGATDEQELTAWASWCEADPENLAAFERLLPLWQALGPLAASDLQDVLEAAAERVDFPAGDRPGDAGRRPDPDAIAASAAQALPLREQRSQRVRPRRRRILAWAGAAALVLGLGAASLRWLPHWPVPEVASVDAGQARYRTVTLPDGSGLELGGRSTVAVDFKGPQRQIEMGEGQAFFRVKPDPERPFVVQVGGMRVTAVGTAFDVLHVDRRIAVTVQEGMVDVVAETGAEVMANGVPATRPVRVPAGYQLVQGEHDRAIPVLRAVDPSSVTAWRQGRLEYNAEPLESVIANVNRYAARPVTLQDSVLGQLRYTGIIRTDAVDEWLRALPQIFAVEVRSEGNGTVILPRAHAGPSSMAP